MRISSTIIRFVAVASRPPPIAIAVEDVTSERVTEYCFQSEIDSLLRVTLFSEATEVYVYLWFASLNASVSALIDITPSASSFVFFSAAP
jgi:hypothetical protein